MTAVPWTRQTLPAIGSPNFPSTSAIFLSVVFILDPNLLQGPSSQSRALVEAFVQAGAFVICSIPDCTLPVHMESRIQRPKGFFRQSLGGASFCPTQAVGRAALGGYSDPV